MDENIEARSEQLVINAIKSQKIAQLPDDFADRISSNILRQFFFLGLSAKEKITLFGAGAVIFAILAGSLLLYADHLFNDFKLGNHFNLLIFGTVLLLILHAFDKSILRKKAGIKG